MKAFAITARDSQPSIEDLPIPVPASGEVLVEVETATVNGFDLSVAAGYVWDMIPHEFPVVLGRDVVGAVTAVGDGVEDSRSATVSRGSSPAWHSDRRPVPSLSSSLCRRARSPVSRLVRTPSRRPSSAWPASLRTTRSRR